MARILVCAVLVCICILSLAGGYSFRCPNLPHPDHGKCYISGYRASYKCDYGYRLSGSSARYCRYGSWDGQTPLCLRYDACPQLSAPHNGHVHVSGKRATYTCHNGYRLYGRGAIFCTSGQWGGTRPVCRKVEGCSLLQDPANGRVTVYNGLARYICNLGFWLDGASKRQCTNGRWVPSSSPRCRRVQNDRGDDSDSDDDESDESDDESDESDDDSGSDTDTTRYRRGSDFDSDSDSDSGNSSRGSQRSRHSGSDSDSDSGHTSRGSRRSRGRSGGSSGSDSDSGSSRGSRRSHSRSRSRSKSRSRSRSRSRGSRGSGGSSGSDSSSRGNYRRRYGSGGSSGSDGSSSDRKRYHGYGSDSSGGSSHNRKRYGYGSGSGSGSD